MSVDIETNRVLLPAAAAPTLTFTSAPYLLAQLAQLAIETSKSRQSKVKYQSFQNIAEMRSRE